MDYNNKKQIEKFNKVKDLIGYIDRLVSYNSYIDDAIENLKCRYSCDSYEITIGNFQIKRKSYAYVLISAKQIYKPLNLTARNILIKMLSEFIPIHEKTISELKGLLENIEI